MNSRRLAKAPNWSLSAIIIILIFITLPYGIAYFIAGEEYVFGGFLFNPLDGNSYLAKINQGWAGNWLFTLPFTAERGAGSLLNLFYLFLGHLSRVFQIPVVVMFHLARLAGAVFLLLSLMRFAKVIFRCHPGYGARAFFLAAAGSGLGWLALPWGTFTSDFWVAEAFPFLSAYATPHFAIGLALLLELMMRMPNARSTRSYGMMLLLTFLLANIQPFAIVILWAVTIGINLWDAKLHYPVNWKGIFIVVIGGGIPLLYQYWVIHTDPLLAAWNAQNLTPAPPLWDLALSLSPAILVALYGFIQKRKTGELFDIRLLLVWLAAGLVLIYFPFNLQRRFMLGIFIPTAMLAAYAFTSLKGKWAGRAWWVVVTLSLITNITVLLAGIFGAISKAPAIYLTSDEYRALQWISAETAVESVILASPEMGTFIPAHTGRCVLYGHPFETVNADQQRQLVIDYLSGRISEPQPTNINYIFVGPREQQLGSGDFWIDDEIVYQNNTVTIFRVE